MSVEANFFKLPHLLTGWPFEVDHLDAIMLLSKAPDQWYGDWIPIPFCLLVPKPARHTGAGPPEHLVPETRLLRFLPACDAHPRPFVLGSLGHCICTSHDVPRRVLLAHRTTLPWRVNGTAHRTDVPRRSGMKMARRCRGEPTSLHIAITFRGEHFIHIARR